MDEMITSGRMITFSLVALTTLQPDNTVLAREAISLDECRQRCVVTCSRCSLVNLNATPCCGQSVILIGCLLYMSSKKLWERWEWGNNAR